MTTLARSHSMSQQRSAPRTGSVALARGCSAGAEAPQSFGDLRSQMQLHLTMRALDLGLDLDLPEPTAEEGLPGTEPAAAASAPPAAESEQAAPVGAAEAAAATPPGLQVAPLQQQFISWLDRPRACPICFDDFPAAELRSIVSAGSCTHRYCTQCCYAYIKEKTDAHEVSTELFHCPECPRPANRGAIESILSDVGDEALLRSFTELRALADDPKTVAVRKRLCCAILY